MRRLMLAMLAVVAAAATPAFAQDVDVDVDALAQTARLAGDVLIAEACHLRPRPWFIVAEPAILAELNRMTKHLSPSGGLQPADAIEFIYASLNQATDEGAVQWQRYGQAACDAIQKDGSLARIDALVAGFKKPD